MRTATAYLRRSTNKQGLSIEVQRSDIRRWAEAEGVEVAFWRTEKPLSGATAIDKRPALTRALDDVESGAAAVLIVAKRDRLSRDYAMSGAIEYLVTSAGGELVSADGVGNGDDESDVFRRAIEAASAHSERKKIRRRTKAALAQLRADGQRLGSIPYGQRVRKGTQRRDGNGRRFGGQLEPDPKEQTTIALMRELRDEGLSYRALADELCRRRIKARSGKPFLAPTVRKILLRVEREQAQTNGAATP